ncbi:MAG: biotin--[acetyl-CoA-carboxylase] ligase [Tepidisphaeraceae bacterium]
MNPNAFQLSPLRQQIKPFALNYFSRLRSTSDFAARMRRARRLYAPAIVLTSHQLAGRGRGSNTWWSGEGSLTVTFALPTDEQLPPHQIPLIAGMAVREALATQFFADSVKIKWPNDLWHDDLKLAGLLCERLENVDLVGLGLNVNVDPTDIPSSLRHKVTSLQGITGRKHRMNDVLTAIARAMDKYLLKREFGSFNRLLHDYNAVHALNGRRIRVTEPGEQPPIVGECTGLDPHGRLLLKTPTELHRIVAGHVELV